MKRLFLGLFLFIAAIDVYGMEGGRILPGSKEWEEEKNKIDPSKKEEYIAFFTTNGSKDIINTTNADGETVVHLAVRERNVPLLYESLLHGADATKKNNAGKTPLTVLVEGSVNNRPTGLPRSDRGGEKSWLITKSMVELLCASMKKYELKQELRPATRVLQILRCDAKLKDVADSMRTVELEKYIEELRHVPYLEYAAAISEKPIPEFKSGADELERFAEVLQKKPINYNKANILDYEENVVDTLHSHHQRACVGTNTQKRVQRLGDAKREHCDSLTNTSLKEIKQLKEIRHARETVLNEIYLSKKEKKSPLDLTKRQKKMLKERGLTVEDYFLHVERSKGFKRDESKHTFIKELSAEDDPEEPIEGYRQIEDYRVEKRVNTTTNTRQRKLNQSAPSSIPVSSSAKKKLNQSASDRVVTTSDNTNNMTVSNTVPNVSPYTIITRGPNITVISDMQTGQMYCVPTQQQIAVVSDQETNFIDESSKYSLDKSEKEAASEKQEKKRTRDHLEDADGNQSRKRLREGSKVVSDVRRRQAEGYRNDKRPLRSTVRLSEETKRSGGQNE